MYRHRLRTKPRTPFGFLRIPCLLLLLAASAFLLSQLYQFDRGWKLYPPGLTAAGIPIRGLNRTQAEQRLEQAYAIPVELHYGSEVIQATPAELGCQLNTAAMLASAESIRTNPSYRQAFWEYLFGQEEPVALEIPLDLTCPEEKLRSYLQGVAVVYNRPPTAAQPLAGTTRFARGQTGTVLDVEASLPRLQAALHSLTGRVVDLPLTTAPALPPDFQNLGLLLRQVIKVEGYDGVLGLYLVDLQTGQDLHLILQDGKMQPTQPDAAFSASSTIKIPILISIFRQLEAPSPAVRTHLEEMIGKSNNLATDWLMQNVLEPNLGPLYVTEDMRTLGLEDTFLAGYFYPGAPLLQRIDTPANQRIDLVVTQDPYSQSTPTEMGGLLQDIYQCSKTGGGTLTAVFPGEVTQAECQEMLRLLRMDHMPDLISGGLPEGTPVYHKHGWVTEAASGVIKDMSDAAIIKSPGGDFVLVIYLYHPVQLVWQPSNRLFKDLAQTVYNYFNVEP